MSAAPPEMRSGPSPGQRDTNVIPSVSGLRLPSLEEYKTLVKARKVSFHAVEEACRICGHILHYPQTPKRPYKFDEARYAPDPVYAAEWRKHFGATPPKLEVILSMAPCAHNFHESCIMNHLTGVQPNRNLCPTCSVPLCHLAVLEPEREVECLMARWQMCSTLNTKLALIRILNATDELFISQHGKSGDEADYTRIPRYVRDEWEASGQNITFYGPVEGPVESRLFELIVAHRVHERLVEAEAGRKVLA